MSAPDLSPEERAIVDRFESAPDPFDGHWLIVGDDVTLEHPDGCVACPEGEFEVQYGLGEYARWTHGRHPVAWWGGFYDGEYDCGLGIDMERWSPPQPSIIDPAPPMRVVRQLRQDVLKEALRRIEPGGAA